MRLFLACVLAIIAALSLADTLATLQAAELPADRVAVMCFHRTEHCPTCRKLEGYAQEAVRTGSADEMKSGKVELHDVDSQNPANDIPTKGCKVEGLALVAVRVNGNKAAEVRKLPETWVKVRDKQAFFNYVQGNSGELLKQADSHGRFAEDGLLERARSNAAIGACCRKATSR